MDYAFFTTSPAKGTPYEFMMDLHYNTVWYMEFASQIY